jgi:hypothetical protein
MIAAFCGKAEAVLFQDEFSIVVSFANAIVLQTSGS